MARKAGVSLATVDRVLNICFGALLRIARTSARPSRASAPDGHSIASARTHSLHDLTRAHCC
jgi:hypothetical protein